mgnify:CR=1 FL=1
MAGHQQVPPGVTRRLQILVLAFWSKSPGVFFGLFILAFLLGFAIPLQEDRNGEYKYRNVKRQR